MCKNKNFLKVFSKVNICCIVTCRLLTAGVKVLELFPNMYLCIKLCITLNRYFKSNLKYEHLVLERKNKTKKQNKEETNVTQAKN